ncbi:GTP-binding protein [Stenotrophomonas tumulicola]|uniref:ATP/GTP-binding protein n=1 Tax=Stenotrophomonas tumulicola TaxID=1685415 RepID=A0A7W3FKV4_9GAMM|nr:ATP/GTP-binding protein [Stenotrophomonas tumulicola]MBA8681300.1 ATP/GTP-binding protein [Stenotrophomonas tumulicola]
MREYKIVVLGGMGSGKSTLVRSIAAGSVVDTDVANSDRLGADKATTTVAMDYADIDLPNGDRLRLYGTPGQQRFDFLWPVLLRGASGVLLLVDGSRQRCADELSSSLQVLALHGSGTPVVVGVTRLDLALEDPMEQLSTLAVLDGLVVPVVPLDARTRLQGMLLMDVLMGEMEAHALVGSDG